jgi:phosphate transport system permease protein
VTVPVTRDITRRSARHLERLGEAALFVSAAIAIVITLAIFYTLIVQSLEFFKGVSVVDFLTDTVWSPLFENPRYGIAPLLMGTFLTTLVALTLAVPFGIFVAVYLAEFAGPREREIVKPALELIAAVPTVVFGYFALTVVTPLLRATVLPDLPTFNMLSAGLVIGILIIPYIASLSEDALRAVPNGLREGSYAMGATRLETAFNVVLPAAASGVAGALVLGMSRAVGETMIVAIAGGQQPNLTINPTESAATVTAYIAQVAIGDVAVGTLEYRSIFAAGFALLVVTLLLNLVAFWLKGRYREEY